MILSITLISAKLKWLKLLKLANYCFVFRNNFCNVNTMVYGNNSTNRCHRWLISVPLSASRPSRIFSVQKPLDDPVVQEIKDLREARAARLAKIYATDEKSASEVEDNLKAKKKKEEARLAEERWVFKFCFCRVFKRMD